MPLTIKSKIVIFEQEVEVKLSADAEPKSPDSTDKENEGHKYAVCDTEVAWETSDDATQEVTLQWVRDKYKVQSEKKTDHSFSLLPNYTLQITTIPGLNYSLATPIGISFERISFSTGKQGRYFPEKGEEGADHGKPFNKADLKATITGFGDKINISLSDLLNKGGGEKPPATTTSAGGSNNSNEGPNQDTEAKSSEIGWLKIDKKISGLHLQAIGFQWKEGKICVFLNASVTLAGLKFAVMGLQAKMKPSTMFKEMPEFDLDGLEVGYYSDQVSFGAALLKEEIKDETTEQPITQFIGAALLELKNMQLLMYGMGAYAQIQGKDSLFLYFGLNYPLGGPPFFVVQGLSIGIGYNRKLIIPMETLEKFPLIKLAMDGSDAAQKDGGLLKLAKDLSPYIPPSMGTMFVMAGVKFNSFGFIDSFALFVIYLTGKFKVELYGLSRLTFGKDEINYAYIEIKLKGVFVPEDGYAKIDGAITDNSYVFSKDVSLTGEFAFYTWWKGKHAGDFVLTVGGYHPEFEIPDHYPTPKRVALDWELDSESIDMSIHGELYMALTPSMLMAGIKATALLSLSRDIENHKVGLDASFYLAVDFLMQWEPFYYEAKLETDIHFSCHIKGALVNKKLSLSAGAEMTIKGPEFYIEGSAYLVIDLGITTLKPTVKFKSGNAPSSQSTIAWSKFEEKLLPKKSDRLTATITKGGIDKIEDGGNTIFIVNPKEIEINIDSKVPATVLRYNGKDVEEEKDRKGSEFGILPMGIIGKKEALSKSNLTLNLSINGKEVTDFLFEEQTKNLPAALWGKTNSDMNGDSLVRDMLTGGTLKLKQNKQPKSTQVPNPSYALSENTNYKEEPQINNSADLDFWCS